MKLITRDELREKLDRGDEFKLVMTLSAWAYHAKHIPTSFPVETLDEAVAVLDPGEEIVVYCADVHCTASIYAYHALERRGYSKVRRYAGGIADWEAAGYPLESGAREPVPERRPEKRSHRRRVAPPARTPSRVGRPWYVCA
jgi:rhodanese-related sulfurtransferase